MVDKVQEHEQDRYGNRNPKLDQLRGQEGMSGADGDDDGIMAIAAGDTGTNQIVYEIPEHTDEAILDFIQAHNSSDATGTFRILEGTLDDQGNIDTTTRRSVLINVASGATRSLGYEGDPFTGDVIIVNSSFEGEFGLAVLSDHKQYNESATEQA